MIVLKNDVIDIITSIIPFTKEWVDIVTVDNRTVEFISSYRGNMFSRKMKTISDIGVDSLRISTDEIIEIRKRLKRCRLRYIEVYIDNGCLIVNGDVFDIIVVGLPPLVKPTVNRDEIALLGDRVTLYRNLSGFTGWNCVISLDETSTITSGGVAYPLYGVSVTTPTEIKFDIQTLRRVYRGFSGKTIYVCFNDDIVMFLDEHTEIFVNRKGCSYE